MKIYETDSYCMEFDAVVKSCEQTENGYHIVLNRTAFFPEGGGQAADTGALNGIPVTDVQKIGEKIVHQTESPLPIGEKVVGTLHWEQRFRRMQSHAGEHMVSGIVHRLFGYSNIGFHMGNPLMTVDFDGVLSKEEIAQVEREANQAIYRNSVIRAFYPTEKELSDISYRSKIELAEETRLVIIEGVDCCACCAPHPSRTGEIGLIKIIDSYPNKQGTRIEMLAGISALEDYARLNDANKYMMRLLSASRDKVADAVAKQSDLLPALRSENGKLSRKLALSELEPIALKRGVYAVSEGLTYDDLRYCCNALAEQGTELSILLSPCGEDGYLYAVAGQDEAVAELVKQLNSTFSGKGGGRGGYAQGKLAACSPEELQQGLLSLLN